MKVEWKPIPGFSGYSVSNTGEVRSEERVLIMKNGVKKTVHQRVLRQSKAGAGYLQVHLGRYKREYVHRLVASAFLGTPLPGYEVNHKDENKENNCISNIEWVCRSKNLSYGTRDERCRTASAKRSCPVVAIKDGVVVLEFESIREAERAGFIRSRISACCRKANSTHKGLHWRMAKAEKLRGELDG